MKHIFTLLIIVLATVFQSFGQSDNFRFKQLLATSPNEKVAFSVPYNSDLLTVLLQLKEVSVKSVTKNWIFIQASPLWITSVQKSGLIEQFYFEFSLPQALNDSTLLKHKVDLVHQGAGGLQVPFTGKDVIIGFVDQGIDYTHPDFIAPNGQSRVLYYWDHNLPVDPNRTPLPYGYGQVWNNQEIQNGICTSTEESTAHGTSVAGVATSNGLANGKQKGMAPEANIIMIETNFNLPNWTLTVADACDFIFKKADSLGVPAVVNLSVGSYLGSHDGDDPASELMETLLDEKPGRIIVCAAGNAGSWGKYHVRDFVTSDTSFFWIQPNPTSQLGANTVYADVWADITDATWSYSFGANKSSGTYSERATTQFRSATSNLTSTIYDTLWRNGNRIATIEIYPEQVGNNVHLEIYFSQVDSTNYIYSFKTKGSGMYDAWTGSTTIGLNNIVQTLPSPTVYPRIIHYNFPDTLQTIVSSWNCSEKVISVGNVRNRLNHIDKNGNLYNVPATYNATVGQLSPNSSKGPSRKGLVKPDVSACGDVSLSAGPNWILNTPLYYTSVDIDGLHVRNGGTSMASPVIAGIAALYLEKCSKGTYQTFKDDLLQTSTSDVFTGTTPNYAYGYGKADALALLLLSNGTASVNGPATFCLEDDYVPVSNLTLESILWSTGDTSLITNLIASTDLSFIARDTLGCVVYSDTLSAVIGDVPIQPIITVNGTTLSTQDFSQLQWFENGQPLINGTNDTLLISLPSSSFFTVVATSPSGCANESLPYNPSLGITSNSVDLMLFPNPAEDFIQLNLSQPIAALCVFDANGKRLTVNVFDDNLIEVSQLKPGVYFLDVVTETSSYCLKFIKK
jgi:hypothetical protein